MSDFVEGATTSEVSAEATTEATVVPPTVTPVEEWVGEGKKYKSVDDLASAYKNADQRLEELKLENERLAAEKLAIAEKAKGVDDVLAAIQTQQVVPDPVVEHTNSGMTTESVTEIVAKTLADEREAATRASKVSNTWTMMDEAFGSREAASKAVQAYMGDDPSRKSIINDMAITDPAGLMRLIGKDVERKPVTFTQESSGGGTAINLDSTLTWEMAQQVRKKDPKLYYSHAFKQRMLNEIPRG